MVEVNRDDHHELVQLLEDAVQYWCDGCAEEGRFYSGETAWKIVSCFGEAKEIVMGLHTR